MKNPIWRILLALALLAAITYGFSGFQAAERGNELKLWFFDVGQGDSILLDTADHHQILIDGGWGSKVLSELSKALPINDKEIDLVISTHNDADHLGGINEVLKHYKVDRIWLNGAKHSTKMYEKFIALIAKKKIPTTVVTAGKTVKFGDLEGIAISPLTSFAGIMPQNQNDGSIVTFWQYGSSTILLTADAEAPLETQLVARGLVRQVDILKVAHHGSKNGSSEDFLRAVKAKIAVIQVGKNNRYGHPAPSVMTRLKKLLPKILRTDTDGTIRFDIWLDRYSYQTGV
ncbi:hypothetical protein A3A71_03630 [Candidatus Berkelbacteria bacterium RIFCSPLOWO2_01_FULL_50_28]|uniref:Metallo-beta-lactamase domain-containing protein n=1 Tax=Candidatus Berkelbacteria bacterium RIFCSPLOWO2_01_FULL_50_28 TaxID=1797471 RepID=A0A1F5ECP8_9BACT|nr:MAG: hypothetical protein A2807_03195 [Candidatus Berkelbacteria bacterium RIFCSPHIGHO2_01_FULL_50_36]OGD63516.1 MAG: hypothetical protein A3F39_00280 [Candidatus Berkelbacteria bacterium RIFCSPHIGHO2_12_FULL_50_11]OGD65145.1 MAG: hypothetical protein A3A71_03630 [Candidatus Berkelbacteria bacterium RIFCSPLOWO2_01_FULL_50_28]